MIYVCVQNTKQTVVVFGNAFISRRRRVFRHENNRRLLYIIVFFFFRTEYTTVIVQELRRFDPVLSTKQNRKSITGNRVPRNVIVFGT